MKKALATIFVSAVLLGAVSPATARDARIRYVTFNNDNVTTVNAALGISTMIEFSQSEVIETVSAGDTKGWSIVPKRGSRFLFIKPLERDAWTNVNIVTSKRVYSLMLKGTNNEQDRASFQVRFKYPDEDVNARLLADAKESAADPDLKTSMSPVLIMNMPTRATTVSNLAPCLMTEQRCSWNLLVTFQRFL